MTLLDPLPQFRLPMLSQNGSYRAFEVTGDAMLPFGGGTVVVARYLEDWRRLEPGTPCVVVSTEGNAFRRVTRRPGGYVFELHADNPLTAPYTIHDSEVLEIWEVKSYISRTLPIAELTLGRVATLVQELQQQVAQLKKNS